VESWVRTRGGLDTILRLKSMRVAVLNYLASSPLERSPLPSMGLTKDKLPKSLGILIPLVRTKEENNLRLVMTCLNLSRCISGNLPPDFSQITNPPSFSEKTFNKVALEIERTIDEMGIGLNEVKWTSPHLSTKAGPNGIAMTSSMKDLLSIPLKLRDDIALLGGDELKFYMKKLDYFPPDLMTRLGFHEKNTNLIRKLSVIHDPEGKTRIIAIFDYWSQTALKPLHDSLMSLVKCFKGDCTFDQGLFTKFLPKGRWYYSYDLKSCTDRLPVELQRRILAKLIGEERANAWKSIMVDYPFHYQGSDYLYSTGQGMGGYSSWASMALCHHLIIRTAARLVNVRPTYSMLGDDLVIAGKRLAECYHSLITDIGVEIAPQKSYKSKDLYEFAKRQFYKHVEITGAPLHGLGSTIRRYHFFIEQLNQWEARLSQSGNSMVTRGMLSNLYSMSGRPLDYSKRLANKAFRFSLLPRKGDNSYQWAYKLYGLNGAFGENIAGCNATPKALRIILVAMLTHMKSKVIEKGLKETVMNFNTFLKKVNEHAESLNGEVSPDLLREIPPIRCSLENVGNIQAEYDRIRSAIYNNQDEVVYFDRELQLSLNPLAIFSLRPHENVLSNNAWLLKELDIWMKGYFEARDLLADEQGTDDEVISHLGKQFMS